MGTDDMTAFVSSIKGPARLDDVNAQLLNVLREGVEGKPADQVWDTFLYNSDRTSLFGTMKQITPRQAFHPLPIGPRHEGSTRSIAAEAWHTGFGFRGCASWLRKDGRDFDWINSFDVDAAIPPDPELPIDDDLARRWNMLIENLQVGYEELQQAIRVHAFSDWLTTAAAIGSIAHLAYHLGVIRARMHDAVAANPGPEMD